jgi:hypothetical protein
MFTTTEKVKELTDYDVTVEQVARAQAVIESFVGRIEVEVLDPIDLLLLERATAYQAAYMNSDESRVYEQAAITQIAQFGQSIMLANDGLSPWIAPLAKIACRRLSWQRMRSVKTGSIFHQPVPVGREWFTE